MTPDAPAEAQQICKAFLRSGRVRVSQRNIRRLLDYVKDMIERFGSEADSDKPDWMSTTYYWLQQADGHRLREELREEQALAVQGVPAQRTERSRSR